MAKRASGGTPAIEALIAAGVAFTLHPYAHADSATHFGVEAADEHGVGGFNDAIDAIEGARQDVAPFRRPAEPHGRLGRLHTAIGAADGVRRPASGPAGVAAHGHWRVHRRRDGPSGVGARRHRCLRCRPRRGRGLRAVAGDRADGRLRAFPDDVPPAGGQRAPPLDQDVRAAAAELLEAEAASARALL